MDKVKANELDIKCLNCGCPHMSFINIEDDGYALFECSCGAQCKVQFNDSDGDIFDWEVD